MSHNTQTVLDGRRLAIKQFLRQLITPSEGCDQPRYFIWVDFLRGIAAISILIYHYFQFYYVSPDKYLRSYQGNQPFSDFLYVFYTYGPVAVQLFWTISGFVFASVYLNHGTIVTAKDFFINRFARLYPLHFVTLITVAVLQLVSSKTLGHYEITSYNDSYHFLLNLGFISSWGLESGWSFNNPIWSVSVEILIYIIFFISIPHISKKPLLTVGMILCFQLLLAAKTPGELFWWCGSFFYSGCFIFNLWRTINLQNTKLPLLVGVVCTAIPVFILKSGYLTSFFFLMILPAVVMLAASIDRFDIIGLGARMHIVGDMTYSVYLWHTPIQIFILVIIHNYALNQGIVLSKLFFLSYMLTVLVISYVSFNYIELPLRLAIRKKFQGKPKQQDQGIHQSK